MNFFWLSFSDAADQFLGVIVVEATTLVDAVAQTHAAKINPGGQIASFHVPLSDAARWAQDDAEIKATLALPRLTLLSKAMLEAAGVPCMRTADMADTSGLDVVCEDCN